MQESQQLPEPIFTPTTKAHTGHDEPLDREGAIALVGEERFEALKSASIELYRFASDYAAQRGIILADTKLEFGLDEGQIVLADELFTPDSSRFWPANGFTPGRSQPSFDKQYVRDYARVARMGQGAARAGAPGQGGDRNAPALPGGLRTLDRHLVRGVRGRPAGGAALRVSVLVRPKAGILDPQGEAVEGSLRKLGFDVSDARVGRLIDLEVGSDERRRCARAGRRDVPQAARQPADRELRDRAP